MGPIEILWGSLVVVFGLIGVVRGFLKEIGVTTVLAFLLFMLTFFEKQLALGMDLMVVTLRIAPTDGPQANLARFAAYSAILIFITFISYEGETLVFEGRPLVGPLGIILGLLVGLLNGYFVIGSLWHYLHILDYPISLFGLFHQPLSPFAQAVIPLLPEALIPPFGFLAIAAFLIFVRVLR